MAAGRTVSILRTTVVFGLLGPLSASIVILLFWGLGVWRFGLPTPKEADDYWPVIVIVIFFGYYIGGIPALLTGLASSLASTRLTKTWMWVAAATALIAGLMTVLMGICRSSIGCRPGPWPGTSSINCASSCARNWRSPTGSAPSRRMR